MYSVIQPIEVLDENNAMVSTWVILKSDIVSIDVGSSWIMDNVEEDVRENTWVIKTSHVLRLPPLQLNHICYADGWIELEDVCTVDLTT